MGGFLHLMQNNLSNLVVLIEIIHQPETQHDANRLETINCLYFFPFLIGAAMIADGTLNCLYPSPVLSGAAMVADGKLKAATLLLCQFRRQFWLTTKAAAANG